MICMNVTVTLRGPLKKYLKDVTILELQSGTSLRNLLSLLALPKESVSLLIVNGEKADIAQELQDGDRVQIYPPVSGG